MIHITQPTVGTPRQRLIINLGHVTANINYDTSRTRQCSTIHPRQFPATTAPIDHPCGTSMWYILPTGTSSHGYILPTVTSCHGYIRSATILKMQIAFAVSDGQQKRPIPGAPSLPSLPSWPSLPLSPFLPFVPEIEHEHSAVHYTQRHEAHGGWQARRQRQRTTGD